MCVVLIDLESSTSVSDDYSSSSAFDNVDMQYDIMPCVSSSESATSVTHEETPTKTISHNKRKINEVPDRIQHHQYQQKGNNNIDQQQYDATMHQQSLAKEEPENADAKIVVHFKCTTGRRSSMEDRNIDLKHHLTLPIVSVYNSSKFVGVAPIVLKDSLEDLFTSKNTLTSNKKFEHFDYIAIFDGHGGTSVSDKLSKNLHQIIKKVFKAEKDQLSLQQQQQLQQGQENPAFRKQKGIFDNSSSLIKEHLTSSSSDKSASTGQPVMKSDKSAIGQTQEKKTAYAILNNALRKNNYRFDFLSNKKNNNHKLPLQQNQNCPPNQTNIDNTVPLCLTKVTN